MFSCKFAPYFQNTFSLEPLEGSKRKVDLMGRNSTSNCFWELVICNLSLIITICCNYTLCFITENSRLNWVYLNQKNLKSYIHISNFEHFAWMYSKCTFFQQSWDQFWGYFWNKKKTKNFEISPKTHSTATRDWLLALLYLSCSRIGFKRTL